MFHRAQFLLISDFLVEQLQNGLLQAVLVQLIGPVAVLYRVFAGDGQDRQLGVLLQLAARLTARPLERLVMM